MDMRTVVFFALSIGFASGIFLRSFFDISLQVLAIGICFALFVAGSMRVQLGVWSVASVGLVCIAVAFTLGVVRMDAAVLHDRVPVLESRVDTEVTIEGVIEKEVDERARTAQITVRAELLDGSAIDERILVIADRFPTFSYGERVRAVGILARPETFETELGRTFDYPGYLSMRGITYTLPFAHVEAVGAGEGNVIITHLLKLKYAFMYSVELQLPEPYAGLAEGLVLGVKRALGDELEEAFRVTGIIHIVVLSGYNVTIVAEAIMRLLSFFFGLRTRVVFGMLAIAAFALIAGLSATVLRASIMAVLVLAARATGRIYDLARALVLAGVIMLLANPKLLVFDPGFQLSFLATMGLIVLAPLIERRLSLVPSRFQIREFVTATIATQIFVLPLLLFSIGQLSLVAVIVNVLVLPAVPLAMLLIFLSGVVGFLSIAAATPIAFCAYVLLRYMIEVVEWFAAVPYAAVVVPAFPFWVVILSYAFLGLGIVWASRRLVVRET